jgi:modulator of FtsH protease
MCGPFERPRLGSTTNQTSKELTMATTTLDYQPVMTRDKTGALFSQTMGLVAATAGLFALGTYLARDVSYGWGWVWFVAAIVSLIGINVVAQRSEKLAIALLGAFGILLGAAVAPTLSYYAQMDPQAVWEAGGATALFIAGFGAAGYATRRDLSVMARGLFWALLALIVFGIVLTFTQIPGGDIAYSVIGLVIFAGLTSYDFQRLRRTKDIRTAPLLAASIFLDIVNVFLLLLAPFSGGEK